MYAFLRGANLIYEYDTVPQKNFSDVTLAEGPVKILIHLVGLTQFPKVMRKREKAISPEVSSRLKLS